MIPIRCTLEVYHQKLCSSKKKEKCMNRYSHLVEIYSLLACHDFKTETNCHTRGRSSETQPAGKSRTTSKRGHHCHAEEHI
jgi:hypothetical protein